MIKLRDYQKLSINDIIKLFNNNEKLVVDATFMGGGKTIIILEIVKYYLLQNKKIVILLTLTELIKQLEDLFKIYNINYEVIQKQRNIKNKQSKVWIIMEQSYNEKKRNQLPLECDILIKDEFHIGYMDNTGKRYLSLVNYFKPKHILGLSGTPYNKDGYLLKGLSTKNLLLYGNARELTKKGYLVPLKYYITKWSENINYKTININNGDYSISQLNNKINNNKYLNLVVDSMNQLNAKNKKTLVYAVSIEHAIAINNILLLNGYKTAVIHSKQKDILNETNIFNFNHNNKINCLVSVGKLTTGFNSPIATLLVNCRPTKILTLYLQIIFRVARPFKNKKFAEILDLAQAVSEHGFGDEPRIIKNRKIEKLEKREGIKKLIINNNKPIIKIDLTTVNKKLKEIKKSKLILTNIKTDKLINQFNLLLEKNMLIAIFFELLKRIKNKNISNQEKLKLNNKINNKYYQLKKEVNREKIEEFKNYLKELISNY